MCGAVFKIKITPFRRKKTKMRLIQTLLAGDSCSYIIFVLSFMMIIFIIRLDTPLKVEIEKNSHLFPLN